MHSGDSSVNPSYSLFNCTRHVQECWLCLHCLRVFCGRYGAGHMLQHYQSNPDHSVALGIGDLSFWCYQCDSYINHLTIPKVFKVYRMYHFAKFKENVPADLVRQYGDDENEIEESIQYQSFINMESTINRTRSQLLHPTNPLLIIDQLIGTFNQNDDDHNESQSHRGVYLYYHEDMTLHYANRYVHENPDRIIKTIELLSQIDLLNKCTLKKVKSPLNDDEQKEEKGDDPQLQSLQKRYRILTEELESKSNQSVNAHDEVAWFDSYCYFNKYSHSAAKIAYESCTEMFINLMDDSNDSNDHYHSGFALIRPPGHHSNHSKPMGFCLFNNVGIGINTLREYENGRYSDCKFAVIDWDIHHGNGTQDIFYDDDKVLYISIHEGVRQFVSADGIEGTSYLKTGRVQEIGGNDDDDNDCNDCNKRSKGKNINIPLNVYRNYNEMGYGDDEYLMLMEKVIIPVLKEFEPDLCIISSGFDAGIGDKMGSFRVSPIGYGLMTRMVINAIPSGKVGMVLEGGYNLCTMPRSIACCIYSCLMGKTNRNLNLKGYETEFIQAVGDREGVKVFEEWRLFKKQDIGDQHRKNNKEEIEKVIAKIKRSHSDYWNCLK